MRTLRRDNVIDFETVSSFVASSGLYRDSSMTLEKLALKVGTNRTALYNILSAREMSFSKFINMHRAHHALDLLRRKDLRGVSVSDIAEMSGFTSTRHMNGYLRKIVGVTAHDFRLRVFGE